MAHMCMIHTYFLDPKMGVGSLSSHNANIQIEMDFTPGKGRHHVPQRQGRP